MKNGRWLLLSLALIAFGLALGACGGNAPASTPAPPIIVKETVVVQGTPQIVERVVTAVPSTPVPISGKLFLNMGAGDIPSIDPALSTDTSSIQIVDETTVGLTRQNEETAATEAGMAKEWKRSDDGLKWTFTLNTDLGVKWVKYNAATGKVEVVKDGDKDRLVTAKDFEYGFKRTLSPKTAGDYAYVLVAFIKGAEAFNKADLKKTNDADLKKLEDAVAVKAVDDTTLEITMLEPSGFFPAVAGLWVGRAQPSWLIAEKGERWTEAGFFQGYGPYVVKEWVHDSKLVLIANPFWPGTPNIPKSKIDEITFYMLDQTPSMANYETGKQDVTDVPLPDMDRVRSDPKLSKELKIAPILCSYYYGYNTKKKPFDNAQVRLAFSLAVDRQGLIDNVLKGGQEPAQWFTRPGLQASPTIKDYPNLGVKYDPVKAKQVLTDAGFADVSKLGEVTLVYNTNEGHKKIAEAIQQMWKKNLGVDVKIANQEWKVFLKTLSTDAPQVYRLGWCQDYPDANNFLKEVFGKGGAYADAVGYSNPKFDDLLNQAFRETDLKKRTDLYAQAEKIFVEQDSVIIPIYWYTTVALTKPYVTRTYSVLGGQQHYEKWSVAPH